MPKDLAIRKAFNQHRQLIDLETYWAPLCCRKYTTEHLSSQHKTPYFVKQNTLLCIAKECVLQCKRHRFAMQSRGISSRMVSLITFRGMVWHHVPTWTGRISEATFVAMIRQALV